MTDRGISVRMQIIQVNVVGLTTLGSKCLDLDQNL